MTYREQTYIERSGERCFCEAAAVTRCRCCGRGRCAEHVARRLCSRCGQAVDRSRGPAAVVAATVGVVAGVVASLASIAVAGPAGALVGFGVGPVLGVAARAWLIARRIRTLRPVMATTVGELPGPTRDEPAFPEADVSTPFY